MAGKVRHLLEREGRYYARRVVPKELRAIMGKRELQQALGADRRSALVALPSALHRFNVELDYARAVLAQRGLRQAALAPLSSSALARVHYQNRLAEDAAFRHAGPSWASISIDDGYVRDIRALLAGRLSDAEIEHRRCPRSVSPPWPHSGGVAYLRVAGCCTVNCWCRASGT
jgi:hypothetical protein